MKYHKQATMSGIRIENTISMAVQVRNHRRNPVHLLVIALFGAIGSIFTFLSMFQPPYYQLILIVFLLAEFIVCALMAFTSGKWRVLKSGFGAVYVFLLYLFWEPFCSGFIYLVNTVYKTIYMTDWERFTISEQFSESYGTTVFLIFVCMPILYMLCYAVLHFQNFFLSLIATLPYAEIGFYFGVAPNHIFAMMLTAFWFSMAAVHLANFGAYHGKEQNSFLRRDNTFFPVSSMRFMVTEKIGILVLAAVMLLSLLIQQILVLTDYKRSDQVKTLRRDAQDFLASVMMGDSGDSSDLWKSLWIQKKPKNERVVVSLGEEAKREFDNVSISGLTFSDLPEGRLYLKYHIGEIYDENSWYTPEEAVYESDVFQLFETLEYYPQEFLYANRQVSGNPTITMTMHNVTDMLARCVPYAFKEDDGLQCLHDNAFSSYLSSYEIVQNQDYENILLDSDQVWMDGEDLYQSCRPEHRYVFAAMFDYTALPALGMTVAENGGISATSETLEAALLCHYGYKDYVMTLDTQIPATLAMENVRAAYAPLLDSYNAHTATAAETVAFLQVLREVLCNEMTYTLAPGRTPSDEDFVEYFLLENQKGYCMHYATSGVMLARMAGIPARYCEGYMIDCNENPTLKKTELDGQSVYSVDVLDSNAHAWAEFYIDGWGWIPFEFTFTQTVQPEIAEPTTEATQPTTEITTQSVTIHPDTTSTVPTEPIVPAPVKDHSKVFRLMLTLLSIFLILAAIPVTIALLRRMALHKRNRLFSQADRNAAAGCIYAYLMRLLSYCGVRTDFQSTSAVALVAAQQCKGYLSFAHWEEITAIAAKAKFSHHTITEEELHTLLAASKKFSRDLYRDASVFGKIRMKFFLHLI